MESYQVLTPADRRELTKFLVREGQYLLPMVKLIEAAQTQITQVIDVTARACIEAILELSAIELAGAKTPGKASGELRWHGTQPGVVHLGDRKLKVLRPRLRHKDNSTSTSKSTGKGKSTSTGTGEEPIPAYEALKTRSKMADRMLQILIEGVSTRRYKRVIQEMADSIGISKSAVSRANIEAGEKLLKELAERRFDQDILVIYIDGLQLGSFHVLGAIGVDSDGGKHVLGLVIGSSENAAAACDLLNLLVERGVKPGRKRLFVIDGSKALRAAIDRVYGTDNPVQRCRIHKMRNVIDHLPKDQHKNVKSMLCAAWKLEAHEGKQQIQQMARWYEKKHPSAAASLREGLDELFTINEMNLPPKMIRCLASTNVIESAHWGARQRVGRVTNWQDGSMALRWSAAAFEAASQNFRRIMGHHQMWVLQAQLDAKTDEQVIEQHKRAS
jgi:putative transposase